jgi:RNA polymerase sigma factor (sigma-70 family)
VHAAIVTCDDGGVTRPARRSEQDSADAVLLQRIRAGDQRAVDDLYDRFRRPAFALARRVLGEDAPAEDVVRDVFVTVWRDPAAFDRSRGSVASWLLALVHHRAVDTVRREVSPRRRQTHPDEDVAFREPAGARDGDPEAWGRVVSDPVRVALRVLPSLQREALALAYYGGYTQREVAALTGTPLATVKTRMLAGMRRLREELGEPAAGHALGGALGGAAVDGPAR